MLANSKNMFYYSYCCCFICVLHKAWCMMENVTILYHEQRNRIKSALKFTFWLAGCVSLVMFFIFQWADLASNQITALPVGAMLNTFGIIAAAGMVGSIYGAMISATCFALVFIPTARIVIASNFVRIIQKIQDFNQPIHPAPISTGCVMVLATTCLAVLVIQHATPYLLFSITNSLIFYS